MAARSLMAPLCLTAFCMPGAQSSMAQDDEGVFGGCDTNSVPVGQLAVATRAAAMHFGSADIPPIPADFFNPGSLPFEGTVYFQAAPPTPNATNADMNIDRKKAAFVGPPGSSATVSTEIVALNLVSVEPIMVTVGADSELWDVQMTLPPGPQPIGPMTIFRTHIDGGTFDSILPICPEFTFIRIGDGEVRTLAHCDATPPLQLGLGDADWVFDLPDPEPVPSDCMYLPEGHVAIWQSGDTTLPSFIEAVQAVGFVDCNGNLAHDTVDILSGSSFDVNGNGIPDECECPGEVAGVSPGAVNVADLLALLAAWGPCPPPCPPLCPADVNGDCTVNVSDLLELLAGWGPCPTG